MNAWNRELQYRVGAAPVSFPQRPPQGGRRSARRHHRTIFISDTHLGTRGCKAEALADFLEHNDCDTLYLVGDIVDGWRLKRRWFWPEAHNRVLHEILHKVDMGRRVIFIPGNHDEAFREFCGRNIAGVEVLREHVHETADGKRLLVLHGDQFDAVIAYAKWLAHLGDWAYSLAVDLNEICGWVRRTLGLRYWSLSGYLKQKVKNAVEYICRFEEAVAREAGARGLDGVVCGHIHHAQMRDIGSVLYLNDGDWVESCTALVEDAKGHLEILRWADASTAPQPVVADSGDSRFPSPPEASLVMPPAGAPAADTAHFRVLIVTDAWSPQVNGVVRTLEMLGRDLAAMGHDVRYATPEGRFTVPLPTYSEIRLAIFPRKSLEKMIDAFDPNAIHIATEGTIGLSARAICIRRKLPFTTSFHTRFPDYVNARLPFVPKDWVYRFLRWFHDPAAAMMVATDSLKRELEARGFHNLKIWSRGVDVDMFRPISGAELPFPKPIWLYVGRIAVEKNIEAFLKLDLPGTKVLIGDGPARASLERRYPGAKFLGPKKGEDLVRHYAASDVFVFPSRTDTFGLVMLEALACGVPVAAFPVEGPRDVVGGAQVAVLDEDLRSACMKALSISREGARAFALTRSWRACTDQFLSNLPVG